MGISTTTTWKPSPSEPARRVCQATGLHLVAARGQRTTRIQKVSYGALNPLQRPAGEVDRKSWGRYDVPGHRTIYGAVPRQASYAESLAVHRLAAGWKDLRLSQLFDDLDADDPEYTLEAITVEWTAMFHMPPKKVVAGWRRARLEYTVTLPWAGWFVDVEAPESIAAVHRGLGTALADLDVPQLTTSDLRGECRELTTTIAQWIHRLTLDDGHLPHGVTYGSKHGTGWQCYAVWLRALDDKKDLSSEPTKADDGCEIRASCYNPVLREVENLFDLKVW